MADFGELVHLRSPLTQCKNIILEFSETNRGLANRLANRGYKPWMSPYYS